MLVCNVEEFCDRHEAYIEARDWERELRETALDYTGQEVCIARRLIVKRVKESLPPRDMSGQIDITSLAEGSVRAALENPSLVVLSEDSWPCLLPTAPVLCDDQQWEKDGTCNNETNGASAGLTPPPPRCHG